MIRKSWAILAAIAAVFAAVSCGGRVDRHAHADSQTTAPAPWELVAEGETPDMMAQTLPEEGDPINEESITMADAESAPEEVAAEVMAPDSVKLPTVAVDLTRYGRLGRLAEAFNDSNKYQYAAGERIGIKPIRNIADAYYLRRPLVKIQSCKWYDVDELTHSMPYLVPEAAALLETIGRNFADSLKKRNAEGHKFRVTSVLRSAYSVKRLRRVNRNATDSSTHKLGTTFDISYAHFNHDGKSPLHSDEELKYILAEVLRDLRHDNKCLVKYERKSPCYHITATGR